MNGSIPLLPTILRSIAQLGSALRLGRRGPRFESLYSDQFKTLASGTGTWSTKPSCECSIHSKSTTLWCV
jgi:hypothetical protein